MPYRAQSILTSLNPIWEGITLIGLATLQGGKITASMFTDADWARFTGPNAFLFGCLIAIVILWNSGRSSAATAIKRQSELDAKAEARDAAAEAREARMHQETLERQDKNFADLMKLNNKNSADLTKLTVDSITASLRGTYAVETLAKELSSRPCGMKKNEN